MSILVFLGAASLFGCAEETYQHCCCKANEYKFKRMLRARRKR